MKRGKSRTWKPGRYRVYISDISPVNAVNLRTGEWVVSQWQRHGGLGGNPNIRQKLLKKNGIELGRYTFRLKNYVEIPPFTSYGFFRGGAATVMSTS